MTPPLPNKTFRDLDFSSLPLYFAFITIARSSLLPKTFKKKKKTSFPPTLIYSLIAVSHASVQFQELPGFPSRGAAYRLTLSYV